MHAVEKKPIPIELSVLNLFKNIVGTSILSLSFGVSCSGVIPSVAICISFALLSGLTFAFIGTLCVESETATYRGICEKYIHPKTGVWIDLLMAVYTFPACTAYSVFLYDCIRVMLVDFAPQAQYEFYTSRAFIGIILSFFVLLPLSSISKLDKLTFASIFGVVALIYCYIFVAYDLAQNADSINSSKIIQDALWWPPSGSFLGLFPMANIYASCYVVQYNAPKFFKELKNPTKMRFYSLSLVSNFIVLLFCGSFAVLGFARFGNDTPDNLLVGYSGAYAVWIATCVSVITTYPLVFDAGRNSFMSALDGFEFPRRTLYWATTLFWVPILSLSAIFIPSLSLVVGISGSICGMTVGFTLPGLIFANRAKVKGQPYARIFLGYALMITGLFLSVIGLISMFVQFN